MATLGGHDYGGIGGLSGGLKSAGGGNGPLGAMHPQSPWAQIMANYWRQSGQQIPARSRNSAWGQMLQQQNYQGNPLIASPVMPKFNPLTQGPTTLSVGGGMPYSVTIPSWKYFK